MIIKPKVRGFMCTTAHPTGCEASVREQIAHVKAGGEIKDGPKNVLVIGASTGYGLASRITAAFGAGAKTIGLFFERPGSETKPGTAGWYNSAAFHKAAEEEGLYAKSFNGDAFSNEMKERVIKLIKEDLGKIDLVIYSLASPRREDPNTGEVYKSTLKPIGKSVTNHTLDTDKKLIKEVTLEAATQEEIDGTIGVMGGADWEMWIDALAKADVLSDNCKTTAYTYLGDKITWDIYWEGTIGQAKKDLDITASRLNEKYASSGVASYVSVLKAVVTQASSAIPIMPLYLALLFKVMKEQNIHEGCIEQINRLFRDRLYADKPLKDDANRFRVDELELQDAVQKPIEEMWPKVTNETIDELTDFDGYQEEFLRLFGFGFAGVDYEADVDPNVQIKALVE